MSAKATFWAWEQPAKGVKKLVLLCLADCHNADTNRCDPSINYIAKQTGLNLKTIPSCIDELEKMNLISYKKRAGISSKYFLNVPQNWVNPKTVEPPKTGTPNLGGQPPPKTVEPPKTGTPNLGGQPPPKTVDQPPPKTGTKPTNNLQDNLDRSNDLLVDPFDQFWSVYPKRVKRKPCVEIWKRKKLDSLAPEIIKNISTRLECDQRWLEGFIPDPTTYLNQERWEDEIQTTQSKKRGLVV